MGLISAQLQREHCLRPVDRPGRKGVYPPGDRVEVLKHCSLATVADVYRRATYVPWPRENYGHWQSLKDARNAR